MARNTREELLRFQIEASGDKELAALASKLEELSKGSGETATKAQQLVGELEKLAATSSNIKQYTALKAAIADTGEQLGKAKERMAALAAEADRSTAPTKRLQASLERAARDVENLSKQQNRQQAELGRTTNALRAAGVDTDKLGKAYADAQGELADFAKRAEGTASALDKTGKESKGAAAGVSTLDKAAEKSSISLGKIATRLTLVSGAAQAAITGLASLGFGTFFKGAIDSATELEQTLGEVRAVSGATAEEMERLKAAAIAGSQETNFSAKEAAQGLGELARATGSAQQAIAALPATLNLAQAAGIGVAEAAQFITTTLTQFGLGADQASRVADVLAKASNSTTADVTGLGNSLSYAAPLARQLGLSLEDTTAIVGAMADQGFRGERAGTALRNTFSAMLDPSSQFAQALREAGIESTNFIDVIQQLAAKGEVGKRAMLSLEDAARPAILALVNSGTSGLRELQGALEGAGGSAAETARIMGDTLAGAEAQIAHSFDNARQALVAPILKPLADELTTLSAELQEFAQSPEFAEIQKALQELFIEGAAAAKEFLAQVDFKALAESISDFARNSGSSFKEWKENIGIAIDAVVILGRTFSVVFNAIQTVILGVASVVARNIQYLAKVIDTLSAPQRKLMEFLGILDEGQFSLGEFAGGMGAVADDFAERTKSNFGEAVDAVQGFAGSTDEAGTQAKAGLDRAASGADGVAAAAAKVEAAGEQAKAGLAGQAQGAVQAAAATDQAAGQMEGSAERVRKAYADLGIKAQADLQQAASAARRNFDIVQEAATKGEASAEDARRAFAAYAQAALAAVADSDASAQARVQAELRTKAATIDASGAFGVLKAAGLDATSAVASGAKGAASAVSGLGSAATSAASSTKATGDELEKSDSKAKKAGEGFKTSSYGLIAMSQAAVRALGALNRLTGIQSVWLTAWNATMFAIKGQSKAVAELSRELDDQLALFDPLSNRLAALREQYKFVDDEQLRALAEKQQRLEDETKRAADEKKRAAEDARRARQEAAAANAQATEAGAATTARRATGATVTSTARTPATAAGGGQLLATLRVQVIDGDTHDLQVDPASARSLLEELRRSQAVSQRTRF